MTTNIETKQKRIEDLTLRELDMIYSLVRVGEWPDSEIARRYRISESDVHKVFDNYSQLRKAVRDVSLQAPESKLIKKKPRKRRSDARYPSAKDRQAAYRARLRESRRDNRTTVTSR